ncbi:hypothetical protein EVAR_100418_1 [Eumeta japonica]|uniref:Uncharacterized protein n=1 Tax=Eumeta variegata TaxID=151549 RepID=A0A4C2A3G0_EUMVA|nr:hypothetical protein EVAR_100418_1 [Eumeta japonica]
MMTIVVFLASQMVTELSEMRMNNLSETSICGIKHAKDYISLAKTTDRIREPYRAVIEMSQSCQQHVPTSMWIRCLPLPPSGGVRRRRRRRPPTASRLKGSSQQKNFAYKLLKKGLAKSFAYKLLKEASCKPDVADVHEWCSAATASTTITFLFLRIQAAPHTSLVTSQAKSLNEDNFSLTLNFYNSAPS